MLIRIRQAFLFVINGPFTMEVGMTKKRHWYKLMLWVYLDGRQIRRYTRRFMAKSYELAYERAALIRAEKNDSVRPGTGISYGWGCLEKEVGMAKNRQRYRIEQIAVEGRVEKSFLRLSRGYAIRTFRSFLKHKKVEVLCAYLWADKGMGLIAMWKQGRKLVVY